LLDRGESYVGNKFRSPDSRDLKTEYQYGWSQPENYVFKSRKGLDHEIVDQISVMKGEPEWMRKLRHEALDIFLSKPIPTWGADLSGINYRRYLLLHQADRVAGQELGRCARRHQGDVRQAGHPRGRAQVPGRRGRAV
jgi:hypothetical protein